MTNKFLPVLLSFVLVLGCREDQPDNPLVDIPYQPTPANLEIPDGFPRMSIPADNPLTVEGLDLGRRLFFDPIISADYSMSCASCHLPEGSFTDNFAVSKGIDGIEGRRSAMSLLNIGFADQGLFWDGRSPTLEDQALLPVEDSIELHNTWTEVVDRLQADALYPELFRKAFGIERKEQITKELAAKAMAQFERSLISSGNSRYDRYTRGEIDFTDEELLGYELFFDFNTDITDAQCGHCHNAPLFTTNQYLNNGIESVSSIQDFPDKGRGEVSADPFDNGRFRVPTLRNIEFSAPYMHDGRFQTLEEVVDHYNSGGHFQENKDPLIQPLHLLDYEKEALLAFIRTLSDTTFIQNPSFQDPFK
ncbi:MAG: cytochrome C peroxidase [Saprospiraceae bacterium]|nr:cytochrome C peroxidase [Saprospiraceae bacterium]